MGFGGIPYFIKMDSLHVKQLMFHPLDWEWVLYNCSLKGSSYVIRGARQRWWRSSMLERYAQEMVGISRMWHFPDLRNREWIWMKLTHVIYLGQDG
jgi:hypothetical protein